MKLTPHLSTLGLSNTLASFDSPNNCWLQQQPFYCLGPVSMS